MEYVIELRGRGVRREGEGDGGVLIDGAAI